MHILSPYGKDVDQELTTVYGLASPQAAAAFIVRHVQTHYGMHDVAVETLYVAYGLTARLSADGAPYYLKFASRSMHARPEQLFPWLAFLHQNDIPVPEVLQAQDGRWFLSPLATSDYEVVYLMRALPGRPMHQPTPAAVQHYAKMMVRFHRLGSSYAQLVVGSLATWQSKWGHREQLRHDLEAAPLVSQALLTQALALIEATPPQPFSSTIIHGDFRLCHVLFDGTGISGMIDVDQSTQGECWVDLCYGLLSGATPEAGSLFDFAALKLALQTYHRLLPFGDSDRQALKAHFAYATLETLRDLLPGVTAGTATVHDVEITQQLFAQVVEATEEALLGEG
ncbi:MAG: phosphotransferase [Chloroflexaceae bacterium]|jgi:Ser/Thr protein kinase RdoA (MazF antagonist)|nr:phosphotransferase [Chloroflexaceae bacterium]